jgi:hypothetical protein
MDTAGRTATLAHTQADEGGCTESRLNMLPAGVGGAQTSALTSRCYHWSGRGHGQRLVGVRAVGGQMLRVVRVWRSAGRARSGGCWADRWSVSAASIWPVSRPAPSSIPTAKKQLRSC